MIFFDLSTTGIFVICLISVCSASELCTGGGTYSVTSRTHEPITCEAHENATFYFKLDCKPRRDYRSERYTIVWQFSGQNSSDVRLARIDFRKSKIVEDFPGMVDIDSYYQPNVILNATANQCLELNITLIDMNITHNGSRLLVYGKRGRISQSILIGSGCSASEIPTNFTPIAKTAAYTRITDHIQFECKHGKMFGKYSGYLHRSTLQCGYDSNWMAPKVMCSSACREFDQQSDLTYSGGKQQYYQSGTTIRVNCRRGKMISPVADEYVIDYAELYCKESGNWRNFDVHCWNGQYIHVPSSSGAIIADRPTLIICRIPPYYSESLLTYDTYEVMRSNGSAYSFQNMTSSDYGKNVTCEFSLKSDPDVKLYRSMNLDVKFPPEPISDRNVFYLKAGESGHVSVWFRSNPLLRRRDVEVTFNGSLFQDTYLKVNRPTHEFVLHFTKVSAQNFGDYVITVTSLKFGQALRMNVKIAPTEESSLKTSWILAITFGLILFLVIIGVIGGIAYVKMRMERRNRNSPPQGSESIAAVRYRQDESAGERNYEEIKATQNQSSGTTGYYDLVEPEQPDVRGPYVNIPFRGGPHQ